MARKATLVGSDLHYGDGAQLHRTLQRTMEDAIRIVKEFKPDETEVVINGDAVAGRGIFRDQSMQNVVQAGRLQNWWAAWEIKTWNDKLKAHWTIIKGNHDTDNKDDLSQGLVILLKLIGVPVIYGRLRYLGNFSAGKSADMWFDAQHGFGRSSYYANSYDEIRSVWRAYIETSKTQGVNVLRFLRAHTHWMNVGQAVGLDTAIDTTGGWHRQEREALPLDTRTTGLLVYLHDGKKLETVPVKCDTALLLQETADYSQGLYVMGAASGVLREAFAWAHKEGIC